MKLHLVSNKIFHSKLINSGNEMLSLISKINIKILLGLLVLALIAILSVYFSSTFKESNLDIFDASLTGNLQRVAELIQKDPALVSRP